MTITVVAYKDINWYDKPRTEYRNWMHTCKPYGADFYFYEDLFGIPSGNIVVLDEKASILLTEYSHPEHAVYIFGRTNFSILGKFKNADEVRIPTPYDVPFFGPSAAAIVLAHRWQQWP